MGEANNHPLTPPNDNKVAAAMDRNKPSVMVDKA